MDYFERTGQQSHHGIQLGDLITEKIVSLLSGLDVINNKEQYLTGLFYKLCHNEHLLYRLHREYCENNKIYPVGKYSEVPFSDKLRSQVFQIMVSVVNYEFTKFKIMNRNKMKVN